jgi:hypothetical protein
MAEHSIEQSAIVAEIPSELSDLIPSFLENRRNEIASLDEALNRQDFKQIRIWGHNMAGCGEGYGFALISELGRKLESAALAKDHTAISLCAQQLSCFMTNVKIVYC